MRICVFSAGEEARAGLVLGDEIVDLTRAAPELPRDINELVAVDSPSLAAAANAAEQHAERIALADAHLHPPVPRPGKFLAVGLNYRDHIEETNRPVPEFPVFFNKQITCVNGPFDPIHYPPVTDKLDYEGELGMVIGRRCRNVRREDANQVVAGFLVVNDVSVRDWQRRAPTMTLGKSFDTHGPIGPWIVTADELRDPHDLRVRTWVNDELRQDYHTGQMVFDLWEQIEILSTVCTLEPGDIISAGTSSGVGVAMDPPQMLSVGDVVRIEIDEIGHLENKIVEQP